ncbi:MAG: glutamate--tRNA ligase [Acetobacteraceae bacterium]|nr:glutamate--tRNA ligase [Acetobacteraceae bacterium]
MSLVLAAIPAAGGLPLGRARLLHAAWAEAREIGARFVLAIDDSAPSRPGVPLDDLRWLGLDWDEAFRRGDHAERYAAAAARLEEAGRLYPCFEHPDELRAKAERQRKRGQPVRYDRAMLKLTQAQRDAAEAGGKRPHWRFRLSDAVIAWPDTSAGRCEVALPLLSDPVLRDEAGRIDPALALAADDVALGASHIVSGAEMVAVTAVHLDLLSALGTDPARRVLTHLPTPREEGGRRLQGQSLRALRQDGVAPAGLRTWFGDLARQATPRADIGDLLAVNRRTLAEMPFAEVAHLLPGVDEAHWLAVRGSIDLISEARPEEG